MKIIDLKRYLKSIFLVCFIPTGIGLADTFTGTDISNESELSGGTVIDFSNGAGTNGTGTYTEGNVTFSSENGAQIRIETFYGGRYNTNGHYFQNSCVPVGTTGGHCGAPLIGDSLKFSFSSPVSAFGFNWGASNLLWDLKAYDSSNNLLETYTLPILRSNNYGEYYGISSDSYNISYATLIDQPTGDGTDWIFIDNFTYLATSDDGDATYTISGTASTGQTLSTSATTADPDGNGSITSYSWQSSSNGSDWTTIGTSSTYTITSSEEGKSIRVVVAYTDGESHSESVTASSVSIAHVDSGDAVFAISGTTSVGQVLSASQSSSDPDGDGTFSYQWQSSSDNSTWTNISGATNSTYTVSESEDGKYIRLVVTYTDSQNFSETVIASSVSIGSQLNNEWLQPFAAMQSIGLTSIKNNRDLVLAKAGECNDFGWVIDETDFCLYSNSSNSISYVNGDSNYGGYDYSNFNTSIIIEKTFNEEWKGGIAYGVGSSNLDNFNFSGTTANFHSTNTHYSIYGFKQISKNFSLKGLIGGSDFDYSGNRNYLNTTAESTYDADGYTAEIIGIWDFNKFIKESNTLINVKPSIGIAFAAHTQDGFSESGSGDLVTIKSNQAESLLFKTGLKVENQILMEGGKWILIPSLDLNYEFDVLASKNNRKIGGVIKDNSDDTTFVSSKTLGEHYISAKVGADFICTENLSFNLHAKYVLTDGGNQHSYGGGFRLIF